MSNKKELKFKIEKQEIDIKDKTDKYEIRTKGGEEVKVTFAKGGKDELSEAAVEFQIKKKSDGDDKWETFTKKVKYTGGWFFDEVELEDKKLTTTLEAKEVLKPSIGFFGSMKWPMYGVIVLVIFAIGALIWWWVASSKSEDKEEESL